MRLREVKHHAQAQVRIQQVQDKEESQGGRWEGKQIVPAEGWLFCQTLSYYKHLMLTAKYHKVDIIISISQLRKLRFREVKKHTQSHTANQQESRFLQNLTVLSPPRPLSRLLFLQLLFGAKTNSLTWVNSALQLTLNPKQWSDVKKEKNTHYSLVIFPNL